MKYKEKKFNNKKFFVISGGIFLFVIGLIIIFSFLNGSTNKDPMVEDMILCNINDDCVLVQSRCCGCNAGGEAIAINKKFERIYEINMDLRCVGTFCAAVISDDPSCLATPKCVNNKCQLINE